MKTLTTDTWHPADTRKPWPHRQVLCRFSDGTMAVASWNGLYWTGQHGLRLSEEARQVTHFYIFEKFHEQ